MNATGIVQNGVIVLDGGMQLPEGTRVLVSIAPFLIKPKSSSTRVEFPLVDSVNPGSVHLTNQMIGEILDEEDAAQILRQAES
jgi:hypothetical protein